MANDTYNNVEMFLPNVRVYYPSLFELPVFKKEDGTVETQSAGLHVMLKKGDERDEKLIAEVKKIVGNIARANNENHEKDEDGNPKRDSMGHPIGKLLPPDQFCIRDGDLTEQPAKHGHWLISANVPRKGLPYVLSAYDPNVVVTDPAERPVIYNGCRCNVKLQFWFQKKSPGRQQRVNGKLIAVQFQGDDEPIGGGVVTQTQAVQGFGAALEKPSIAGYTEEGNTGSAAPAEAPSADAGADW